MKFKVVPISITGQSILESEERRNGNPHVAEVSIQVPTPVAQEIATAVNGRATLAEHILAVLESQKFAQWYNHGQFNEYATGEYTMDSDSLPTKTQILDYIERIFIPKA